MHGDAPSATTAAARALRHLYHCEATGGDGPAIVELLDGWLARLPRRQGFAPGRIDTLPAGVVAPGAGAADRAAAPGRCGSPDDDGGNGNG